jgi:hypothetical protein
MYSMCNAPQNSAFPASAQWTFYFVITILTKPKPKPAKPETPNGTGTLTPDPSPEGEAAAEGRAFGDGCRLGSDRVSLRLSRQEQRRSSCQIMSFLFLHSTYT